MTGTAARTLLVLLFAVTARATEVSIVFSRAGEGMDQGQLVLRRLDSADDLHKEATVRHIVSVADPTVVELAPGHWSLELEGDSWWMERQLFFVGPEKAEVAVDLWPAGFVSGDVGTAVEGERLPGELTARFQSADDRPDFPAGDVSCPVTEGTFRCKLPAGKVDLRIRAPGYIARHAWNVAVERDAATRVPRVVLTRGASLAGRVELGSGPRVARVKPGRFASRRSGSMRRPV